MYQKVYKVDIFKFNMNYTKLKQTIEQLDKDMAEKETAEQWKEYKMQLRMVEI